MIPRVSKAIRALGQKKSGTSRTFDLHHLNCRRKLASLASQGSIPLVDDPPGGLESSPRRSNTRSGTDGCLISPSSEARVPYQYKRQAKPVGPSWRDLYATKSGLDHENSTGSQRSDSDDSRRVKTTKASSTYPGAG